MPRAAPRSVLFEAVFDIGSSLREARTRQGLDFNEMEFRTKVRAKYLRALEDENFEQLPGHTYIKGFLRTYADSLGMDGQLYVDEYNSRYVAGDEEQPLQTRRVPSAKGKRHHQHRESRLVVIGVVAIVLLTMLVFAAWKFGVSNLGFLQTQHIDQLFLQKFGDQRHPEAHGIDVPCRDSQ